MQTEKRKVWNYTLKNIIFPDYFGSYLFIPKKSTTFARNY